MNKKKTIQSYSGYNRNINLKNSISLNGEMAINIYHMIKVQEKIL